MLEKYHVAYHNHAAFCQSKNDQGSMKEQEEKGAGQVTSVNQHRLRPVESESHFMYQTEWEKTAEIPQGALSLTGKHREEN